MEDPRRIVSAIGKLTKVNFRRALKYRAGAHQASSRQIRSLFAEFVRQSEVFSEELQRHYSVASPGSVPSLSFWETITTTLRMSSGSDISISEFEKMEDESLQAYRQVMRYKYVPIETLQDIAHQMEAIEEAKGILISLRPKTISQLSPVSAY